MRRYHDAVDGSGSCGGCTHPCADAACTQISAKAAKELQAQAAFFDLMRIRQAFVQWLLLHYAAVSHYSLYANKPIARSAFA